MKPFVIAATTLALAGAAFAQAEPQKPPATAVEQIEDAAAAAGKAAAAAAEDAAAAAAAAVDAADQAARAAAQAVAARTTATGASDTAKNPGAEDPGANESGTDEMGEDSGADQATDDAAMAADDAVEGAVTATKGTETATDGAETPSQDATDAAADAPPEVTPPDVNPPAISEAEPGVLSSWVTSRRIWTTGQPAATEWTDPMLQERPREWQDIAKVNDIVLDDSGLVVGYIADIGGFLGIGAKKVLLGTDAIHLLTIGNDTFFVTNYTKAELEALPDFDEKTVRK